MWAQIHPADRIVNMTLYGGRIDPWSWSPHQPIGGGGSKFRASRLFRMAVLLLATASQESECGS
jgi:hypothetical protein